MKKIISCILVGVMMLSSVIVFANEEGDLPFEVEVKENQFQLSLDENATTGYSWTYKINKEDHVSFIESRYEEVRSELVGAGGTRVLVFEVEQDGVSTITLEYKRSWESEAVETIELLVYKNADKIIVEEDQPVATYQSGTYTGSAIQEGGYWMLPLRTSLESLGYTIKWNNESQSITINKGAQWTSIKIGENNYFKNKMSPAPLTIAPLLIEGQTFVPVEFFTEILDLGIRSEDGILTLQEGMTNILEGFINEIEFDDEGIMTLTISRQEGSDAPGDLTIVRFSEKDTYENKVVEKGCRVRIVTSPMMTMSLPAQTIGYIVY